MRHRQILRDDSIGRDVDDDSAFVPAFAPAVDHIAAADGRDVFRPAVLHRHAVQMATVLRREPADEAGLPQRLEAVHGIGTGQAGIFGVDEHDAVVAVDGDLVDVEVAGGLGIARHIEPVELLVGHLARAKHILQAPDLRDRRHVNALLVDAQPHGPDEIALVHGQPAVGQDADQHQLSGLIGGQGEADAVDRQPIDQTARGADIGRFRLRLGGRHGAGIALTRLGGGAGPLARGGVAGFLGLTGRWWFGARRQRGTSEDRNSDWRSLAHYQR